MNLMSAAPRTNIRSAKCGGQSLPKRRITKATRSFARRQFPCVGVRNDKPAQHKKEIDEKPGAAHKGCALEMPLQRKVKQRDQNRTDPASAVEHDIPLGGRSRGRPRRRTWVQGGIISRNWCKPFQRQAEVSNCARLFWRYRAKRSSLRKQQSAQTSKGGVCSMCRMMRFEIPGSGKPIAHTPDLSRRFGGQ